MGSPGIQVLFRSSTWPGDFRHGRPAAMAETNANFCQLVHPPFRAPSGARKQRCADRTVSRGRPYWALPLASHHFVCAQGSQANDRTLSCMSAAQRRRFRDRGDWGLPLGAMVFRRESPRAISCAPCSCCRLAPPRVASRRHSASPSLGVASRAAARGPPRTRRAVRLRPPRVASRRIAPPRGVRWWEGGACAGAGPARHPQHGCLHPRGPRPEARERGTLPHACAAYFGRFLDRPPLAGPCAQSSWRMVQDLRVRPRLSLRNQSRPASASQRKQRPFMLEVERRASRVAAHESGIRRAAFHGASTFRRLPNSLVQR